MSTEDEPSLKRRTYRWPKYFFGVFLMAIGFWLSFGINHRIGVLPSGAGTYDRSGIAHMVSCERDPTLLWVVYSCEAEIQWRHAERVELDRPISDLIRSTRPLEGTIDVVQRERHTRRGDGYINLPADYPEAPGSVLLNSLILMTTGFGLAGLGAVVGGFLGVRFAHLLPEPPAEKSTLRMRMRSRRKQVARFNGPVKGDGRRAPKRSKRRKRR